MPRLVCVGDNVVDRYIALGRMYPGGNAVNVAVGARRSGIESAYVGVVGNDAPGRCVLSGLTAEGVDVSRVRVVDGHTASTDVFLVGGDRVFGDSELGVSRFTLSEKEFEYIATYDFVHTGECSMLEDQIAELSSHAPVSFDFSIRPREYVESMLPHVHFAAFSGAHLAMSEAEQLLRDACRQGPQVALVTRGSLGAVLMMDGRVFAAPGKAMEVTDTLGAGDALIGRALAGYLKGEAPETLLAAAIDAAVAACRHFGAFEHSEPLWFPRPAKKTAVDNTKVRTTS